MRKQICFIVELGPTAQIYYFKISSTIISFAKPVFVEVDDKVRLLLLYQTLYETPTCFGGIA